MSNNVAEYAGARRILKYLSTFSPGKAVIRGDAQLIVNQLEGKWRIKKGMYLPLAIETKELLAYLRGLGWQIDFCWIPREQNEECDALSKNTSH
jgi:ribonuclease HI